MLNRNSARYACHSRALFFYLYKIKGKLFQCLFFREMALRYQFLHIRHIFLQYRTAFLASCSSVQMMWKEGLISICRKTSVEYPKRIFVEVLIFYMRKKCHKISKITFLHKINFLYKKLSIKNILILKGQFPYAKQAV